MRRLALVTLVALAAGAGADAVEDAAILNRGVVDAGDFARVQHVLAKARRGERVVVGVIGGSITAGAHASTAANRWGNRVAEWWRETFPEAEIEFVNAGIGATGSNLGAHRVQPHLLVHKPDLVAIEYAVNDGGNPVADETMEGLVRQVLSSPNQPAAMLLFTMNDKGGNVQDKHIPVGRHYGLPMVSYRDALWPEIEAGNLAWTDIGADNVHPNDRGHAWCADLVTHVLAKAYEGLPGDEALPAIGALPEPLLSDEFQYAGFENRDTLKPLVSEGWEEFDDYAYKRFFGPGWRTLTPGATLEFEVEGTAVSVLFYRIKGAMGTAEAMVDDGPPVKMDGWFSGDWGGYLPYQLVAQGLEPGKHRLRVRVLEEKNPESEGHEFRVHAICTAGREPAGKGHARQLGDLTGPWQLFVDDDGVEEKEGVTRVYHAFEKYAGNPVMTGDKAWEDGSAYVYGSVLPNEDGAGYRMWYHCWAGEYRMLYATSADGLTWDKPALGSVEFEGSTANNILFRRTHENHNPQVIHTPWDPDTGRRYKMMYFEYGRTPPDFTVTGYYGAVSPDGIHWTDVKDSPVLVDSPGDVGNFVWDGLAGRFIGWPKKFADVRGFRRRCVGVSYTENFESWPATELVLVPDEYDDRWVTADGQHTDFYGLCGFAYESMYLGFVWIFRITDGKNDGPIFVELVSSRDGIHWRRQDEPRTPILALGEDGAWDDGMLFTPNHPLVEGDEVKLYYGGFDVTHGAGDARAGIGLATLRKDGFASLDAGAAEGRVVTKAFPGGGKGLVLNYKAHGGSVRVEVLDEAGGVIAGYGRGECTPLTGDSVNAPVSWQGGEALPGGAGEEIRLCFVMEKASLYAMRVE